MKRSEYISRKNTDESFQVDADKAPCGGEARWPAGHHAVVLPHPAPPYTLSPTTIYTVNSVLMAGPGLSANK